VCLEDGGAEAPQRLWARWGPDRAALRLGRPAGLHRGSRRGRFTVGDLDRDDYARIVEVDSRYADLELGLADCAAIVLADRYATDRILSFDERRFRAVAPLRGSAFVILPADA
jgi:hypothetical protein